MKEFSPSTQQVLIQTLPQDMVKAEASNSNIRLHHIEQYRTNISRKMWELSEKVLKKHDILMD